MKERKVVHSISRQFTYIFFGLMAGTILLCWFLNNTFLEEFYINNKQHALLNVYNIINEAVKTEKLNSEEFELQLQGICGRYNMDVLILDGDSQTVKYVGVDPEATKRQLWDNLFLRGQMNESSSGTQKNKPLIETENYQIKIVNYKW